MPGDATEVRNGAGYLLGAVLTLVVVVVLATVVAERLGLSTAAGPPPIHVSAGAAPGGDGTAARPFASVQRALQAARPGDTVQVGPGSYREELRSVRSGTDDAPIRIVGDDARIVGGTDVDHLVELHHDHIELRGVELTDAGVLVWMQHVTGVRLIGNSIHGADGECVRVRYLSTRNEIAGNRIRDCGREDFDLDEDSKNGEGVYLGTAPEQLDRNPEPVPDATDANWVHDNTITVPAECVDVKEDAHDNVVSDNTCSGSRDPDGAGLSSRGIGTVFRGNDSSGHVGAGLRLGGDDDDDGVDNLVIRNHLHDNGDTGLRIVREPQGRMCGNRLDGNAEGPVNRDSYDPARPCDRPARTHEVQ